MVPLIARRSASAAGLAVASGVAGRAIGALARRGAAAARAPVRSTPQRRWSSEAQWDVPNIAARRSGHRVPERPVRGETVMASMGSLGHYMQESRVAGFALRDFLHEGNGDIWLTALETPRPFAGGC